MCRVTPLRASLQARTPLGSVGLQPGEGSDMVAAGVAWPVGVGSRMGLLVNAAPSVSVPVSKAHPLDTEAPSRAGWVTWG